MILGNIVNTMSSSLIQRLGQIQTELRELVLLLNDNEYRTQFHPDISPLGWHLGHTTFTENLWIRETILKDDSTTAPVRNLYLPQNTHKLTRGAQLPSQQTLLEHCLVMQRDNLSLLNTPPPALASHHLMQNDYLIKFLVQHHAMHLETMHMGLTERQLQKKDKDYSPKKQLTATSVKLRLTSFDGGEFEIGGTNAWCFDNELPRHRKTLQQFALNITPTSNAQFLGFIENGGYDNTKWWDDEGLQWLKSTNAVAPHHWLQNNNGAWYAADSHGYHDLKTNAPVYGLSRHEACAFARYAGARLPHENEWEVAFSQDVMQQQTDINNCVWEWCNNTFHPYPNFKPFPYEEYSTPWFDNAYYTLRGCSHHTPDVLQRPSFRNFHTTDKRHIFAGVRVAVG